MNPLPARFQSVNAFLSHVVGSSGRVERRRGVNACEFDQVSGVTRKQVAAAFRLAMAELLSESYDGCLPVIFDDAFAYSDPERVQTVQRMLGSGCQTPAANNCADVRPS